MLLNISSVNIARKHGRPGRKRDVEGTPEVPCLQEGKDCTGEEYWSASAMSKLRRAYVEIKSLSWKSQGSHNCNGTTVRTMPSISGVSLWKI